MTHSPTTEPGISTEPVLLFDMFGVIARLQSEAGKVRLAETAGMAEEPFWSAYWSLRQPYDRGDVGGSAYWQRVADALGTTFRPERIADLIEADLASWSAVDDEMVALIEQLAASGRRIALLSNIPEELACRYEQQHAWLKHFEVCAFSCRIGHAKPEPGAYRWACEALATAPEQILFIDDRTENIEAARAAGLQGRLFTTADDLKTALGVG
ncbi:HAD family hydrolase [Streptomyces sp. NBC_01304]|uniref:HAD family hydrolase n=1 Tax=Streptomyces sp. NBC_01304 TaxID=2903818 RepID=UPI002E10585A|nr:HAD family phosphatase [Streptomyces sp. NBC_01304]